MRALPYAPPDGARAVGLLAGSGAFRASGGVWCVLGGFWCEAPARNAVWAGMPVGARATIRATGRRARGRASGLVLVRSGFLVASGAFWAASGAKRRRVTRCGLVCRSVRALPYALPDGARAVGLLAGVWCVPGGLAGTGVIEAVQAFGCRMSRLIRNFKPSRRYGCDRSGAGVSCGASAARSG